MSDQREWTLSEAARFLGQPQHRLIYLCERGAVRPDNADASGRGSSRRFSERNLLELAIALRLRELTVPAATIAGVLYALRSFETKVRKAMPGFRLLADLRQTAAPHLRVSIADGEALIFSLGPAGGPATLTAVTDFRKLRAGGRVPLRDTAPGAARDPIARVEVDVTRLAQELRLE